MMWMLALAFLQDDTKKIAEDVAALKKDVAALTSKMGRADEDIHAILRAVKGKGSAFPMGRMGSNEKNAATSLRAIVSAEENLKANDVDRNGVGDYWTADLAGMYAIVMTATNKPTACLSDLGMVYADLWRIPDGAGGGAYSGIDMDGDTVADTTYDPVALGPSRSPKAGYWYQAMVNDSEGNLYAQDTDGTGANHNYGKFAFAAIPAAWDAVGRNCYIVNEAGEVYRRDFGLNTTVPCPAIQVTEFAPGTALDWPTEKELAANWIKVERGDGDPLPPIRGGFRNGVTWTCTEKGCKGSVEARFDAKVPPKCPKDGKALKAPEVDSYACSKCKRDIVVEQGAKAPKCCGTDAVKKEK